MRFETRLLALRATSALAAVTGCSPPAHTTERTATCDAVLDQELPGSDPYPGEQRSLGPRAQRCCEERMQTYNDLILDGGTPLEAHRWGCCANVDRSRVLAACTPWGPPVPPQLNRRRSSARHGQDRVPTPRQA